MILYDWLTVSSKDEDPEAWMELLGMKNCCWEEMNHGRNGYRKGQYFGSITILYDGNPGMGSCLDMSGQGCRSFEEYGTGDFDGLFHLFSGNPQYNMTRLDVAFDDHTGILDIRQLFRDSDKDEDGEQQFISRFRVSDLRKKFKNGRPGISVCHGSEKSAAFIRIYDKAAERGLPESQHWVRVELQLRDERAAAFSVEASPIGVRFRGVLFNYVRYVDDPGTDSNRWRWPMKPYWENLIEEAGRIRLYVKPGIEYNIGQLDTFVFDQAASAISAAFEVYGVPYCVGKIQDRKSKMMENPKYRKLVQQYGGKGKSKMREDVGQGGTVHRAIPRGQLLGEIGELHPGHGGTAGTTGTGLGSAPGGDQPETSAASDHPWTD